MMVEADIYGFPPYMHLTEMPDSTASASRKGALWRILNL